MLTQAGSPDKCVDLSFSVTDLTLFRYLEQLRLLAANWTNFDTSTRLTMKTAPFVLASQHIPVKRHGKKMLGTWGGAEDEYEREWVLCKASEVCTFQARIH